MLLRLSIFVGLFAVIMALLMLPEVIVHAVAALDGVIFSERYWGVLSFIVLVTMLDRHLRWARLILTIFAIIFVMQFAHMAYFGRAFDPFAFALLGQEGAEVSETIWALLPILWWVLPLAILPPLLVYYLIKKFRPFAGLPMIGILPIVIFAFGLYRPINFENVIRGFPNPHQPVVENYLTALGSTIFQLAFVADQGLPNFSPYEIRQGDSELKENTTIVVVYGESLSANHFGALGYERDTTPRLGKLLQDPNSFVHVGFSTGVSTRIATPLFFNVVRDPRDRENSLNGIGNMFTLAKGQGFETYYFSSQLINLLGSTHTSAIDKMVAKDLRPELIATRWDEGLIDLVQQEIDWSEPKKRLIVLHTRSAHSPYEKNTQFRPEFDIFPADRDLSYGDYTRNIYDNSMIYSDFVLASIYQEVQKRVDGPLYFWFTSDHGEMVNHNGQYGHTVLEEAAIQVPIGLISKDADADLVAEFQQAKYMTHWDMGRLIVRGMGLDLIDPNLEPDLRYVSGTGNFASHGMLILTPKKDGGFTLERR